MDSTGIRRIHPEAAIQSDAVRRAAARRQRGSRDQDFYGELAREAQLPDAADDGAERTHEELPVAPPADGDAGTHIDLVG